MPLPTIAGTVRATFRGSNVAGQQWANVMHFRYAAGASTPGTTEITALDAKVIRLYSGSPYTSGAAYFTFCPPDIKLIDATYYVLNGTSVPLIIAHSNTGTGTASTNSAQEIAMVLTLRTAFRGRRYRGRIYLPAPSSSFLQGATGQMSSTQTTQVVNQATGLVADLASIQWEWGVASYGHGTTNGQPVTWVPFFTPIQSFSMDGIPDVQRRRKQ